MVSSCPLISSPLVLLPIFGDCLQITNHDLYHRHFHVPYFLAPWQGLGTYLSFRFQFFHSVVWDGKVYISAFFFFLLTITRSGRLIMIKLSVCISNSERRLLRLMLLDKFWVVHISFVCMVKLIFLPLLREDYLLLPILSRCGSVVFLVVPFWGYFCINVIFPFFNYSGKCNSRRFMFISSASLS